VEVILVLILWCLMGFIPALIEFYHQNKRILGSKEIMLRDLLLALIFGVGGPISGATVIAVELFIRVYEKVDITMETTIWRAKDDKQRKD